VNLFEATTRLWTKERAAREERWADELHAGVERIAQASRLFNEPTGLRFYVTVGDVSRAGRADGSAVRFSVRHRGQEVATLAVGSEPTLVVTEKHVASNRDYLQVSTPAGRFAWTSGEARAFRKLFKTSTPQARVKSEEHEFEARILKQLEGTSAKLKFGGSLRGVRHCGLTEHEYPVQFPVPISASTGAPGEQRGNIDILVRHQRAGRTRLSVWELKRPGAFQHALAQAYIYAVTLALMARGSHGGEWYRLFGFSGGVPDELEIEAVAVVAADQSPKLPAALAELAESPLELAGLSARISLHAAVYEPKTLKMSWAELGSPLVGDAAQLRLRG
jgi:hypothetical protein